MLTCLDIGYRVSILFSLCLKISKSQTSHIVFITTKEVEVTLSLNFNQPIMFQNQSSHVDGRRHLTSYLSVQIKKTSP